MDEKRSGVQEAAKFAVQAGCGSEENRATLIESLKSGEDELIREELAELPNLNAFLETISQITGRDEYSLEVVKSYWLGGGLPETEEPMETRLLAEHYAKTISPEFAQELIERLPEKVYLTHLTMVALIASADLSGDARLAGINHCMISGGRVKEVDVDNRTAAVERDVLIYKEGGGFEVIKKETSVAIDPDLTPTIRVNDEVAMHQGVIADVLNPKDVDRLAMWTRKVAETLT